MPVTKKVDSTTILRPSLDYYGEFAEDYDHDAIAEEMCLWVNDELPNDLHLHPDGSLVLTAYNAPSLIERESRLRAERAAEARTGEWYGVDLEEAYAEFARLAQVHDLAAQARERAQTLLAMPQAA